MVQVPDPMLYDRGELIQQAYLWKVIPMWLLLVTQRDHIRPPIASAFYEIRVHEHLSGQLIPMPFARQEQLKALNRYRSEKYMDSFLQ